MVLISLCMITKNEENFLEQCLNSVKDLVKEIVIVDTGSSDQTKEIAKKFTNKIFDFKWCDDFSAARNESLKHATGEWIMILDADEVIAKRDIEKIKRLVDNSEVEGYILVQRNYFKSKKDLEYGSFSGMNVLGTSQGKEGFVFSEEDDYNESKGTIGWMPTPIVRLFRNSVDVFFSGTVHEDVSPSLKGKIVNLDVPIHHFGKMEIKIWKKKWELYERLGEKKVEEEKDYYAYFELGRQYLSRKKLDLAKEMFLRSIFLKDNFWINWFNLGTIYLIENDINKARDCLEKAKELNPKETRIYCNLGVVYVKKKEFEKAISNLNKAVSLNPNDASAYKNLGMCYNEMGDKNNAYYALKKAVELNPKYKELITFH